MTTARIDWTTALTPGARMVPVILVAGVPVVLTPAGVRPTTVAVTSGTVDALWWPSTGILLQTLPDASTFDPVKDLLDPGEVFEIYERASLLKGDVRVEALTFSVLDTDGAATAMLSIREGRVTQLLGAEVAAADIDVTLASVNDFPASGIAAIGRETITYDSIVGTVLTTCIRGKYGSAARLHGAPAERRPLVAAGGPRHWQSRVATLWVCVLSADGLTLTDPTLMYVGTVGAGVQLKGNLSRWSVPLDHVTESLSRKVDTLPIDLYGYSHFTADVTAHPLTIAYRAIPGDLSLQWSDSATDNGGWHPSREAFIADANAVVVAATAGGTSNASVSLTDAGRVVVRTTGTDGARYYMSVQAAWDPRAPGTDAVRTDDGAASWTSGVAAPEACFRMEGRVRIPSAVDLARIPTTFTWTHTTTDGSVGNASLALICDTSIIKGLLTEVTARDAATSTVTVRWVGDYDTTTTMARALLCLERTPSRLAIVARGDCVAALRAGALGIDAIAGEDLYQSVVDWDHLERAMQDAPTGGIPQAREYRFGAGADSFLAILIDELRLRGMCLALRFGRITGVRLQSFSDAENVVAAIVETDLLGADGREIPVEVIDNVEPLATGIEFHLRSTTDKPRIVSVTDATYTSEFGDGERVECKALLSVSARMAPGVLAAQDALYALAQQVLGPLAEPNRALRLSLSPVHMGLQPGMLVSFKHSRIPTWTGVRGFETIVCQVQEVRRQLFGDRLRPVVVLRMQSSVGASYCPEALVAAGGLSGGSVTVALDVTTPWGATCFAQDRNASGDDSADESDGFEVGDVVMLSALDDRTPIADEQRTVTAFDPVANTVTLDVAPSAGMVTQAVARYGCIIRWTGYDAATTRQHTAFAWIAEQAAATIPAGGASPKRYAG